MTRGLSIFVRDNLEAFAVAIALALVVRHYCLEAFRIPSNSMMPTLLGDTSYPGRGGDRILVDKFAWLRHEPRRWEPSVFQYPLNRSRNFIKRLVGLPGEKLRISDGDIWTSRDGGATWRIERKPSRVQDTLFFPFYPSPVESPGRFAGKTCWEAGPGWVANERAGRLKVDAKERTRLRFLPTLVSYSSAGVSGEFGSGPDAANPGVGDARVSFRLAVERKGTLEVVVTEHGLPHRLVLAPEGSRAVVTRPSGREHEFRLDARLEDGAELEVSFANVDDTLVVEIDGDRREFEFPEPATEPYAEDLFGKGSFWRNRIAIEAEGIEAVLTELRVDRDLHYAGDSEWDIPADHFFMLGDNTGHSKDSRRWRVAEVLLEDGAVIRWEEEHELQRGDVPGQPNADFDIEGPDQVIEVKADVDGLVRRFHTSDVVKLDHDVPAPFVSRDHLVGRAFAIFWPIHIWPINRVPTRIGLIR